MSHLEILTAHSAIDFDFDVISCSPTLSRSLSRSYKDKFTSALINGFLSSPPTQPPQAHEKAGTPDPDRVSDADVTIPGLPPLLRGHSDVHLRNGVMNAMQLATDGESDAEKAFFVADLSYVLRQHERWKANLPEIQPFYGEWQINGAAYMLCLTPSRPT